MTPDVREKKFEKSEKLIADTQGINFTDLHRLKIQLKFNRGLKLQKTSLTGSQDPNFIEPLMDTNKH